MQRETKSKYTDMMVYIYNGWNYIVKFLKLMKSYQKNANVSSSAFKSDEKIIEKLINYGRKE